MSKEFACAGIDIGSVMTKCVIVHPGGAQVREIARTARREDIAAGLFQAIAGRIAVMAGHFNKDRPIVFCGGGAQPAALKAALEKAIGLPLIVPPDPQFVTAFGAALSAGRKADDRTAH